MVRATVAQLIPGTASIASVTPPSSNSANKKNNNRNNTYNIRIYTSDNNSNKRKSDTNNINNKKGRDNKRADNNTNDSKRAKSDYQRDPWCVNCDGRVGHKFSDCPSGRTTHASTVEKRSCTITGTVLASLLVLPRIFSVLPVTTWRSIAPMSSTSSWRVTLLCSTSFDRRKRLMTSSFSSQQFKRGQGTVAVLVDSGGSFSCISLRLVKQLGLMHLVQKPVGTRTLGYASAALSTRRLGKITLPMTLHFPHESNHDVVHMTVELEVLDIRHDFLVGSEMIRVIWAGENIARYSIAPSPISRPPTNVHTSPRDESIIRQYFSGATPRVDVLSTLTSSSSSSGSSSRSARVHAANQVPPASAHASTSASPADAHREQ